MNRLFVHNPLFRLLAPAFSGTLVYLLVLLLNDAVLYIQEDFLSQELLVCIGLAYLTQEFSRWSLIAFERLKWPKALGARVAFQLVSSVLLTIALVTGAIILYFTNVLYYKPSARELYVFNSIFAFITLLYIVLYFGHYFLFRRNTKKLAQETLAKQAIEGDFSAYVQGIHPELLFESLEALLVIMKKDSDKAEALADHFASVYRYLLSRRKRELVPLKEEWGMAQELVKLFNHLPYRNLRLVSEKLPEQQVVPTTLLGIIEQVIRTTIPTNTRVLELKLKAADDGLSLRYTTEERLNRSFNLESIPSITSAYRFYTDSPLVIAQEGLEKIVQIPNLVVDEGSTT